MRLRGLGGGRERGERGRTPGRAEQGEQCSAGQDKARQDRTGQEPPPAPLLPVPLRGTRGVPALPASWERRRPRPTWAR